MRTFFSLWGGLIFLVSNPTAHGRSSLRDPQHFLNVRGTQITLPFELRILVQELNGSQQLEISGEGLHDERGHPIAGGSLRCAPRRDAAFDKAMTGAPQDIHGLTWTCKGKRYERIVRTRARFEPMIGFIRANEEMYRRSIELVAKEGHLLVINRVGIEEYLAGLVNREIRSSYPDEAVKAQVIAARSYALATAADRRRAGQLFDLYGTVQDQVYRGVTLEDGRSFRLVSETRGTILSHREDVLKAYYHASSGGHSELPQNVWGTEGQSRDALAYLARPSEADEELEDARWNVVISPKMGYMWPGIGEIRDIKILARSPGRRVQQIHIEGSDGESTFSGPEFRKLFGINWIKSTYFYLKRTSDGWLLEGRGYGHGVGLSQLGAKALAKKGKNFQEILSHYYPYASVRKMNLDEQGPDITIGTR